MGLGLGAYIFSVFLKPVVQELGWTRTTFSASSLPILLAMSLGSPVAGALLERLGARFVFSTGITLVALGLLGLSEMTALWQFYALGFLLGVAVTGLGDIPAGAIVSQWFERTRGLALGVVYVGSNIGGAIIPIVAISLAAESSWRDALRILAIGGWLVIFPFAFWAVRERVGPATVGGAPAGDDCDLNLAEAMRTPSFWILGAVLFSFYFYYIGVNHHLVAFLSDVGFTAPEAARRFGAAVAVGIVGKLAMGLVADRIPKRTAILLTFGLMTAGSLLLLRVASFPAALPVFLVVHGFTVAAENVVFPLMVAECFGVRHLAKIYGAIMLALLPGGATGPIFAGYVFDTTDSYAIAFATFAVLNVAALAGLAVLQPLAANRRALEERR